MTTEDPTPNTVVYKDVVGFLGYRVGDDGSIWSCRSRGLIRLDRWRIMKPGLNVKGYKIIQLRRDGKEHGLFVHRLVLAAFIGPCPDGHEACHNNGIRTDNRLVNLRWGTRAENIADMIAHRTTTWGTRHWKAKLSEEQVLEIRELGAAGFTHGAIAARFGVCRSSVSLIIGRKEWKYI